MGVIKPKHASLSEATFVSVESAFHQSRFLANEPLAAPATPSSPHAVALHQAQMGSVAAPAVKPLTLGDALTRARAIVSGKIPFQDRHQHVDEILGLLQKMMGQQSATELYGNCVVEVARGMVRREIPMNRRPQVTQMLITILDPRAPQINPVLSRKIVRLFSCGLGLGLLPPEAVNAAAAVMLFQMNKDHWSGKERALCLEGFLWGIYNHGYSELYRSSTVGRVLRVASDRNHPLSADDLIRLILPLSSCLSMRKIGLAQTGDVITLSIAALRSRRGSVQERGLLALNIASYMNEDFSFVAPVEELTLVASLPDVDPLISRTIRKKIWSQPESYYRSLSR